MVKLHWTGGCGRFGSNLFAFFRGLKRERCSICERKARQDAAGAVAIALRAVALERQRSSTALFDQIPKEE